MSDLENVALDVRPYSVLFTFLCIAGKQETVVTVSELDDQRAVVQLIIIKFFGSYNFV